MEPSVIPAKRQRAFGGTTGQLDDDAPGTPGSWLARHNTVLTMAAACVAPVLYLVFVDRYAANSFNGDDWSVAPLVHAALHGQLSLSRLWSQFNESRLFVGNLVDVLFGLVDRFDLRSVIFFSAALFIASYALLLVLVRSYLGKPLTPIPVLVIGVVWFSLADVQNALWAFQVSWYLTVFFFMTMQYALLVPDRRRRVWFAVAVVAGLAASLSTVQGFLCWPVGAVCILWNRPRSVRASWEVPGWLGATIVTVLLYFPGYDFSNNGCLAGQNCSLSTALNHPLTALGFFFALLGDVIPGGVVPGGVIHPVGNTTRFVVVGVVLFVSAVFILVQSWRHRASSERLPVPLLLIAFSLVFDLTIAVGRSGQGPTGALDSNRYVMANLMLVTGIVIYAWAHLPRHLAIAGDGRWRAYATWLSSLAVAIFLIVQATVATGFGVTNGRAIHGSGNEEARQLVNLNRVAPQYRVCEVYVLLVLSASFRDASEDRLGEFRPSSYRYYRGLGPPKLFPGCRGEPAH
jgi:hypothetical protein